MMSWNRADKPRKEQGVASLHGERQWHEGRSQHDSDGKREGEELGPWELTNGRGDHALVRQHCYSLVRWLALRSAALVLDSWRWRARVASPWVISEVVVLATDGMEEGEVVLTVVVGGHGKQ